jgi:putative flippase GtrA
MRPLKRMLKYSGVNVIILPLNIATAWILTQLGSGYMLATISGFALHCIIGFFINREWTFHKTEVKTGRGLAKSLLVGTGSFCIMILSTMYCIEFLNFSFLKARLCAALVTDFFGYVMNSIITFGLRPFR